MYFNHYRYYHTKISPWSKTYKNENDLFIWPYVEKNNQKNRKEMTAYYEGNQDFINSHQFKYFKCPHGFKLFKKEKNRNIYLFIGQSEEERINYINLYDNTPNEIKTFELTEKMLFLRKTRINENKFKFRITSFTFLIIKPKHEKLNKFSFQDIKNKNYLKNTIYDLAINQSFREELKETLFQNKKPKKHIEKIFKMIDFFYNEFIFKILKDEINNPKNYIDQNLEPEERQKYIEEIIDEIKSNIQNNIYLKSYENYYIKNKLSIEKINTEEKNKKIGDFGDVGDFKDFGDVGDHKDGGFFSNKDINYNENKREDNNDLEKNKLNNTDSDAWEQSKTYTAKKELYRLAFRWTEHPKNNQELFNNPEQLKKN